MPVTSPSRPRRATSVAENPVAGRNLETTREEECSAKPPRGSRSSYAGVNEAPRARSAVPRTAPSECDSACPEETSGTARANKMLSPGISRAMDSKAPLRTKMTIQKAPWQGRGSLAYRRGSTAAPAPGNRASMFQMPNTAGIAEADESEPEAVGQLGSIRISTVNELVHGESMASAQSPFDVQGSEADSEICKPLIPMHKGGEGIRNLVRARERDHRYFGIGFDYWDLALFSLKGRAWPVVPQVVYSLYCILVVTLIINFDKNNWKYDKSAPVWAQGLNTLNTLLGSGLFFLLSFRTNSSYDRWWEGRKLWDVIIAKVDDITRLSVAWIAEKDPELAMAFIRWSLSMAYLIKYELRTENTHPDLVGILTQEEIEQLDWSIHQPIMMAVHKMSGLLHTASQSPVDMPPAIYSSLDSCISNLHTTATACQRILSTPMPFAYIVHLRSFMILWLMVVPFAFVPYLGYWTIAITIAVGYELLGFETISVEIENPFSQHYNDLPLDSMTLELFAKCRATMMELGHTMDLEPRIMADPLFAHCYYAESHKSRFKLNPSDGDVKVVPEEDIPQKETRIDVAFSNYWVDGVGGDQGNHPMASPFDVGSAD